MLAKRKFDQPSDVTKGYVDQKRIFDLYYTTKPHGSGIGLSLVYRTVQLHDGQIDVESVPARGTTFRILLRQAVKTPARAAAPAS